MKFGVDQHSNFHHWHLQDRTSQGLSFHLILVSQECSIIECNYKKMTDLHLVACKLSNICILKYGCTDPCSLQQSSFLHLYLSNRVNKIIKEFDYTLENLDNASSSQKSAIKLTRSGTSMSLVGSWS